MSQNSNLNVMNMAQAYAAENNLENEDIFAKPEPTPAPESNTEASISESQMEPTETVPQEEPKAEASIAPKKKKEWTPDPSLTADMPELQQSGAVYNKDEIHSDHEAGPLRNIADDEAIQQSREAMDELSRKTANIEEAKARHGIAKLQIPEGFLQVKILTAANDTNHKRSQETLDQIFEEIKKEHPEVILEWMPGYNPLQNEEDGKIKENMSNIMEIPKDDSVPTTPPVPATGISPNPTAESKDEIDETKITIDKRNLSQISWSEEEVNKIKKSRTVELNIVEGKNIEMASIDDIDDNAVDLVLAPYRRKNSDVSAPLPASKYRATFSGLTYPEVLDLNTSQEMNNLDGERKKWSLCFDHIHNQSIGPWEEYAWYNDPETKKVVKIGYYEELEDDSIVVHRVSKFEDFLKKTSFMDLEYMLWKILCATAMEKEIISIDCHAIQPNGQPCNNNYDWIYSPSELLVTDSLNSAVLEEMGEAANAASKEDIMKTYQSSPVCSKDTVTLNSSGFVVVFGHVSAYDYLNSIYSEIKALDEETEDPTIVSRALTYSTLTVVKEILVPKGDGRYARITGVPNIAKTIQTLDEVDWQTVLKITDLMINPYQFEFALRDIVCPKCKNKSTIAIKDMSQLLFIVAKSLSSVNVELKKN